MRGRSPTLDANATRQDETVEALDETDDESATDASLSLVTSTDEATFGRAARADATRDAAALCGMEAVTAPSRASLNVPETASEILMVCCSLIPFAPSHSCWSTSTRRAECYIVRRSTRDHGAEGNYTK